MGRHLVPSLALVLLNDALDVDRQPLVRVDGDAEETRIGLYGDNERTDDRRCFQLSDVVSTDTQFTISQSFF